MRINYYLYGSGELRRQDNSLVFITEHHKSYLPIGQIDQIFIFSSISVNQNVIKLLNEYEVMISFFSYYGQFIGTYMPSIIKTGKNLIDHVTFIKNETKKMNVAQLLFSGACQNMLFLLKYYVKKKRPITDGIEVIVAIMKQINEAKTVEDILMMEAKVKKAYYQCFDRIILNPLFHFDVRSTYPPKNEVNAMMSFGYAMIYSRLEGSIHRSRLALELPFIHGYSKGNSGLQHDLADLFKPIFVDRLVFRMINRKSMTKEDFCEKNGGVYLTKEGMKKFIIFFDKNLRTTTHVRGRSYSYQQIIAKEVHKISRHVHEDKDYEPFVLTRW